MDIDILQCTFVARAHFGGSQEVISYTAQHSFKLIKHDFIRQIAALFIQWRIYNCMLQKQHINDLLVFLLV